MFRVAPPGAYTAMFQKVVDSWWIIDIRLLGKSLIEDHGAVGISSEGGGHVQAGMANWSFWSLGGFGTKEQAQEKAAEWIELHRGLHFWWVPNE